MTKINYKGIFIFAEQWNGEIHKISYELLNKGRELADQLNEPLYTACLGPQGMEVSELMYKGADVVYYLQNELFKIPHEIYYKEALSGLIAEINPRICMFGATKFGRSLAPRVAAHFRTGLTADCTDLQLSDEDKSFIQIRPAFSENILAHIKTTTNPQMVTCRYKEFDEAVRDENKNGEVITRDYLVQADERLDILKKLESSSVDISEASVVVAGGKGLKSEFDFKVLQELAELLGGSVGATRDVVEEGLISREHQVGYSGHRVKPEVYFACGISGAPQHLAGMIDSKIIIAINQDPSAPIFEVADYGVIGDWRQFVSNLIDKLYDKEQS